MFTPAQCNGSASDVIYALLDCPDVWLLHKTDWFPGLFYGGMRWPIVALLSTLHQQPALLVLYLVQCPIDMMDKHIKHRNGWKRYDDL
jgi:hypothetical protein